MVSADPQPLTLLRLKRPRNQQALDTVHVRVPRKRPRLLDISKISLAQHHDLTYRRLPAVALDALGPTRVIDVDPHTLRPHPDTSCHESPVHPTIECNGVPMTRHIVAEDTDQPMYDIFGQVGNAKLQHLLPRENDDEEADKLAWLHLDDLPIFQDDQSSEEDVLSDSDDRSVDYPSTPEHSASQSEDADTEADEDEWRRQERALIARHTHEQWPNSQPSSHPDETSDVNGRRHCDVDFYQDDTESEQEGDYYDYEA